MLNDTNVQNREKNYFRYSTVNKNKSHGKKFP